MAYSRFVRQEMRRRQYTVTKTKAFIAFIFSVFFSIILGGYFEKYSPVIIKRTKGMFVDLFVESDDYQDSEAILKSSSKFGRM